MKKIFSISLVGYISYLIFTTSCANPGVPVGGYKDTISPIVIKSIPEANAAMYDENTVSLTFDEFIVSDEVAKTLVVSPPISSRPIVKIRSKTLVVDLGEGVAPNTTYSLDFKDAIKDNNEKNPLEDYRFSFSTGMAFDTLAIGGYVRNAENMEPMEGVLILLHTDNSLAAFNDSIPDYIAKTDEEGFFLITNIAENNYQIYALDDTDNSLSFSQSNEMIAFYDSSINLQELLVADTLLNSNEGPYYLLLYSENVYNQYLDSYNRDKANLCQFYFAESLTDSFKINLLSPEARPDWSYLEYNPTRDSVSLWINDTIISQKDSLKFQLEYLVHDSLDQTILKKDTVDLYFSAPVQKEKKKKDSEAVEVLRHFSFSHNMKKNFDVNKELKLESAEPLSEFDYSKIHFYQQIDTVEESLELQIIQDSTSLRKFIIDYPWEFEGEYRLEIDSAAAKTYSGSPSNLLNQKFTIQEEDYYAKIVLNISNLPGNCLVQLLKNSEDEELLREYAVTSDGGLEIPYLKPDKYIIKLIVDRNNNGKWDPGDLKQRKQPERVVYFPKILKLRSNFEVRESWVLPNDLQFIKELIDEDQKPKNAK